MSNIITINETPFPDDVRGVNWTLPAWTELPAGETEIGYCSWADTSDPDNYRSLTTRHLVLPDGSAKVVCTNAPFGKSDVQETSTEEETFPAGTWEVEYPTGTFGSRGGCWIQARHV